MTQRKYPLKGYPWVILSLVAILVMVFALLVREKIDSDRSALMTALAANPSETVKETEGRREPGPPP